MDSTRKVLLGVFVILAITMFIMSYLAYGDKSTPDDDGDDPVSEFSFVDTWEFKEAYYVSSKDMKKVETVTNSDDIEITNKYGKVLQVVDGDIIRLGNMIDEHTIFFMTKEDNLETDNHLYSPSENLMFRYVLSWNLSESALAGVAVYVRQGTTVSDSEIDEYLAYPDIDKTYEQDAISSNRDSPEVVSKTTTIEYLEHGLIYLEESVTYESGEKTDARSIGFITPTSYGGNIWGAFTQNPEDVPADLALSVEFSCNKDYFCTFYSDHDDGKSFSEFCSSGNLPDAPVVEGLTLVCSGGNTTLTKDSVTKHLDIDYVLHITEQDGYVFSGYAELNGEKLYDITGVLTWGSGKDFMFEYEFVNAMGFLDYYAYIGNIEDGFDGAGGSSYGNDPKVVASKFIVVDRN